MEVTESRKRLPTENIDGYVAKRSNIEEPYELGRTQNR